MDPSGSPGLLGGRDPLHTLIQSVEQLALRAHARFRVDTAHVRLTVGTDTHSVSR